MNDIEGLREASEWALRELEAGRPKPTRQAFRALLLAWGLDSRQYHAWAREHAPDIELRWSRIRALWAESSRGFIQANMHRMTQKAMADHLGVSCGLVHNIMETMRRKTFDRRKPNLARKISEAEEKILTDFCDAITGMSRRKIPDPNGAYERMSLRLKAIGITRSRVAGLVELHRPDVYCLYRRLQKKRATNLLRIGMADGAEAMSDAGDLNENTCKYILCRARQGIPWFGIALRDGEFVDLKRWRAEQKSGPK